MDSHGRSSSAVAARNIYQPKGTVKAATSAFQSPTRNASKNKISKIASLYDTGKLKKTSNNVLAKAGKSSVGQKSDDKQWLKSILSKEPSLSLSCIEQATEIWAKIQATSCPSRRLSVSDNDLVQKLVKVTNNDPSVTEVIMTDNDPRVLYIDPALLLEVAEAMCGNTHVQKLVMKGMKLGNEFSSALASSLQANCMLEYLDVSNNGFTNVKEFLKIALHPKRPTPLAYIDISNQHSPLRKHEKIVSLLLKSKNIRHLKADFAEKDAASQVAQVLQQKSEKPELDYASLVIGALEAELERRSQAAKRVPSGPIEVPKIILKKEEVNYFLDLEERAKRYRVQHEDEKSNVTQSPFLASKTSNTSLAQISASLFTGDGAFLNNDFIAKYLVEAPDRSLTFEFNNQTKLFRRFTKSDPARETIVRTFVDALVGHPKAADITHLNMANTLLCDDWLEYFCQRCNKSTELLLNLHSLNIESNLVCDSGVRALAASLEKPAWKYLQVIKLDNQKKPLASETETELLHALAKNRTVIKLSLRVRNSCERDQINLIITRNVDLLRQARLGTKPATSKRSRNTIEKLFDSIAENDEAITTVQIISDKVFLSLHPKEKLKAAQSFASNSRVTKVQLNGLQLDDKFAIEFGKSLNQNSTIESIDIENNCFGSEGILALIESLKTNRTIQILKVRHQKKPLSSTDEEKVAGFIEDNSSITSLGLDPMRNPLAKMTVERKIRSNQDLKRRNKARR